MAGFLTDFANNKVLDMFFGGSAVTPPPTLYLGLSLFAANKQATVIEPSGGGYARVPITNNLTNFPAASGGTKANATAVTFPTPTADWGAVLSLFIADAGGNVYASADLTTPKTILNG